MLLVASTAVASCENDEEGCKWPDQDEYAVLVQPDTFVQGSSVFWEGDNYLFVLPQFTATVTRPYWIMSMEATRAEWEASFPAIEYGEPECGSDCPVLPLRWDQALALANAFSTRDGYETCYDLSRCVGQPWEPFFACPPDMTFDFTCPGWRLPTSTEWELAARGGVEGEFLCGRAGCMSNYAHTGRISDAPDAPYWPRPGGTLCPNAFGIYDSFGNAEEWAWDTARGSDDDFCREDGQLDPTGCPEGVRRVKRGGHYRSAESAQLRNGGGNAWSPGFVAAFPYQGVRFVRTHTEGI